jgi:hypothetical protein
LEERDANGLFFGLEQVFFNDFFVQVAFQLFFDENLKLFEMAKFNFFLYYFLPDKLQLL